ncbi:MAG: hypothetical protein ABUS57_20715 [Pseudomonadota bacterium]
MDDEQKKPASNGAPPWILFAVPAILAAIGVYFALTRPAPNEAQARIRAQAGIAAPGAKAPAPAQPKQNGKAP